MARRQEEWSGKLLKTEWGDIVYLPGKKKKKRFLYLMLKIIRYFRDASLVTSFSRLRVVRIAVPRMIYQHTQAYTLETIINVFLAALCLPYHACVNYRISPALTIGINSTTELFKIDVFFLFFLRRIVYQTVHTSYTAWNKYY